MKDIYMVPYLTVMDVNLKESWGCREKGKSIRTNGSLSRHPPTKKIQLSSSHRFNSLSLFSAIFLNQ